MAIGIETTESLEYIDRVGEIADLVRAGAGQADADGQLADATVDALRETGLMRMLLPARYGGGGLVMTDTFPVVEALSRVNGSAGWILQIGSSTLALAHDLADDDVRDEVLGDPRTLVAGTINFMSLRVTRGDGGFVFDGDATFLSGAAHADWLVIGGWLHEEGVPQFTKGGMPTIIRGIVPMSSIELRATWDVSGMRATSSNDATLDAMFVADRYLCAPEGTGLTAGDPAASLPLFSRFGGGLAWVSIGIARGALDALTTVGAGKVPVGGSGPLSERIDVQIEAARALGLIESGAAFLRSAWTAAMTKIAAGETLDADDQAMLRLSYVTGAEYAAHATDLVARIAGSSALFEREGIARCWRDANAVTKHVAVSQRFYERLGRIFLGLAPLPGPI